MSVIVSVVGGSSVVSSKELVAAKGGKPVRIKAIRGGKYVLAEGEQRIGPENITVKRVGKNLLVALEGTKPEHAELIIEDFFGSEGQLVGLAEDGEYHEYIAVDGEQASAAAALYDGSTSPLALGTAVIGGIASALMTAPVGILPYVLAGLGVAAAGVAIERHNDDDSKPQPADTTPPENKGIGSVIDDKDGGRTELKDGASTNDDTPTLVGGGQEPGDTVTIIDNGKVIGEVIVDDKGQWSFTPEKGLGEGEHVLEVIVTDPAGNASKPSDDFTIIVDTTAPAKPVIGSVMDDQGAVVGPVAKGGSTDDTLPTLNGTAEPGTVVHIHDNGRLLGSASVDGKGAWSFTPSTPLGEGEHVFTVTCSDAAGNTSPLSDGHLIVVDTSAPGKPNGADSMLWDDEGPVVGEIKPGDTTDDRTPTFSGKGEPGATVVIQDNGKEIGRVPVGDDGKWSFTPDTPLGDGAHSLDYYVVDGAGNAGQPSDPIEFVVDTSALSVRIDGVTDNVGSVTGPVVAGGVTDDATPTVHGSATPGATVEIHANGVLLGKTTAGADGKWSYTPAAALADGSYAIKAVVVAATGASQSSTEFVIEVDTTAPGKPSAKDATLMDDVGEITGLISSGDTTDDTNPTFSGRAEEGATIVIYDNGAEIGRVVVEDDGDWEFTPENPLVEGDHSFSYEVMDRAGNVSERSDGIEFTVDTSDARVFIEGAVDNVGSKQGSLVSGSVTDDATPTLHGSGTAGAVVKVYDGIVLLGETKVGTNGQWSFTPQSLAEGLHKLSATVTTPALGEGERTSEFELLIDLTAPDKPSIGSVYDDQGEVTGNLTSGQVTDDAKPELKGKGEPNSTIIVKDNGVEIGRTPVDADGNWSFVPETPLLQGEHPLTVVNVDAAGNESQPSDAFVVNVGSSAAPPVPSVTGVIDDVGAVKGNLQKNAITDDARPTITGTAQPGVTISVYDNGKLLGTTQVDAEGEWSFTPLKDLADGPHNLTAKATNAMGNSSPETGPYPIVVDTAAPSKPDSGDATLTDNQGSITGEIKPGDETDDNTPTFAGKTEPGAEVVISDNGNEIGRVTADPEGNWTFTPTTPLADGDHSLSYEVVDQAGNVSEPSDPLAFVVDTRDVTVSINGATDNVGKVQGAISAGGVTDDATPTLHGQATAGGTVKIYDGGVLVGQTTADAEGKWSLELPVALAAGPHSLTATVTTGTSAESVPTPPFTLAVDLSAPNKPVISSVEDDVGSVQGAIGQGKTTDDTTPTLKGTAEAGSTVHIYDNGSLLGSVVAGSNGVWGYTPTTPLNNGEHSFTVTSEDKAGNVSAPSDAYAVTVDTMPPGKPSIGSVYDDQGEVTGNLTSGQVTDDAKPELKGTGEPNSTIIVKDNGVEIGRTPVDADGNWSFVPETPLLQGEHPLTVVNVDAAGNESQPSDAFVVNVGSSAAPAVPSVTGVIDDVGTVQGNLQKNAITDDARPTITGTAQPGVTISVYDNGKLLGTTDVNAKGEWSFTPTTALADGPHNLTAKATNAMGNSSPETGPYPIVVDTAAPSKPDSGDATLTDNEGSITGEIKPGDKTDDSTPTFAGKTEPGAEVVISDNGNEIGRVTADPEGNWTFTPTVPLADGDHSLSYEVVDQAGNVSEPSDPLGFVVDTRDVTVRIDGATDNAGKVQGAISAGGVTDDATPTLHGQATPGGTVKIYDGGVLVGQTTADAEGKWSLELPVALAAGPHSLTATVTTAASGESAPTPPFTLTVDLSAPNKPVISSVEDDVGSVQGAIGQGKTTDDTTPTLKGTAEAGSTVHIYDNGSLLGSVVAGSNGVWNYTPTTPLNNGEHSFTVTSEDKAGNVSVPSDAHVVIVDTVPPGKPSIESVMDDEGGKQGPLINGGDATDDAKPELSGKAEPNGTVIIKDNGEEIGRAPVDANGNWTFTPTYPLANGTHALTVEAMDAAGNVSQPSDAFVVEVLNDGAPAVPSITSVMDDVGAIKGNLQKTDVTDDARPTINGTAEPGVTVSVYSNGTLLGTAVVNAKGEWSFTPDADLADGLHNITAKATNSLGNDSEMTGEYPITVDTLAPGKPGAGDADLVDNEGSIQGTITNGSITDDSTPTFSGSNAEPNATVVIHDNGKEIGRVPTDANGNWTFTPAPALVDGAHSMSYQVVDKAGNVGEKSDPINFTLDSSAVTVRIEGATDNAGGVTGELANGGVTDDATPTLHGTATAGGTVKIYDGNNVLLGETIANAEGKWSFTPATPLPEGAVTLYATVTTGASEESEKTPAFNLILDMTAPLKPVIEKIEDDVGNPQGVLANGQSTDDTTPTLSGKAEAGSTVRIYDNGSLLGSVVVDGAGNWNFTPTTPLNNGPHSFTVTSVDPAGNISVPSDAYVVTVDTVAPGKPAIGSVYDDQGGSTGNLVSGDETDDTRPELKGTGEPNSTIIVKDNGVEIGRVPVDANGNWNFVPTTPLADGEHPLTVVNVDAAGNESRPSDPFVVIVDGSGGGKPEITAVIDDQGPKQGLVNAGESTDDVKPQISGTAKPNSTVSIWDNNVKIGQVQSDAAGNWTFTPDAALQEGSHSIHVTAVDALGSEAEPSAPFAFEVNTGTPETPRISNIRDDVGEYQGIQRSGGHTDDTRPTVTGTGKAGDTIEVRVDGVAIGRGVVGVDGRWSVTSSFDIAEGLHMFTAVAVSPSGVESALSNSYELTIDTTPPESPVVITVTDNAGTWKGELENGDFTDDRTPTFSGKAEPNTTLLVYINGEELGFAAVDAEGNWTYSPDPLTYGEYIFNFQAVDKALNPGAMSEDWYVYVGAASRSASAEMTDEGLPQLQDVLAEADAELLVQPALMAPDQAGSGMDASQVSAALQQVSANADGGMQVGTGVIAKMEDLHVIESPLLG